VLTFKTEQLFMSSTNSSSGQYSFWQLVRDYFSVRLGRAVDEMYVQGVSTRKIAIITEHLTDTEVCAGQSCVRWA